MMELGLFKSNHIPKLFFKRDDGKLALIAVKIVDKIRATVTGTFPEQFLFQFNGGFEFEKVSRGLRKMCFFGFNSIRNVTMFLGNDDEDRLLTISEYTIFRARLKIVKIK